jgi:hypothetical protein
MRQELARRQKELDELENDWGVTANPKNIQRSTHVWRKATALKVVLLRWWETNYHHMYKLWGLLWRPPAFDIICLILVPRSGIQGVFLGARDYGLCFTTHSSGYQNTKIAKTVGSAPQPNHNITLAISRSLISSIRLNRLTLLVCVVVGFPNSEGATGASSMTDDEQIQHPLTTEWIPSNSLH